MVRLYCLAKDRDVKRNGKKISTFLLQRVKLRKRRHWERYHYTHTF